MFPRSLKGVVTANFSRGLRFQTPTFLSTDRKTGLDPLLKTSLNIKLMITVGLRRPLSTQSSIIVNKIRVASLQKDGQTTCMFNRNMAVVKILSIS